VTVSNGTRVVVDAASVDAFRRASGDASPLHCDDLYARRTPFGAPVVHGALATLVALAGVRERDGHVLERVEVRFESAVFPGQAYTRRLHEDRRGRAVVGLYDGAQRLAEVVAGYGPGAPAAPALRGPTGHRAVASVVALGELTPATIFEGPWAPDWAVLAALLDELGLVARGVDPGRAAALAFSSYVVGMEAPGRAALLSSLSVELVPLTSGSDTAEVLSAHARIDAVDERFRLVRLGGSLAGGGLRAELEACAFARAEAPRPSAASIAEQLVGSPRLDGHVALVVGGSRGLGAAIVQALATQGATVVAGFHRSEAEGRVLRSELGPAADRVHLARGDFADADRCQALRDELLAEHGRLDILVLCAAPPPLELGLEHATGPRAAAHVAGAVALARAPIATLAGDLAATGGQLVAISSAYVVDPPPGWSHYVTAKGAVEGLVRAAIAEHPSIAAVIVRPPQLRTALTATPLGAERALPTEPVAAAIARRIADPPAPGTTALLDAFDDEPAQPPAGAVVLAATFTIDPLAEVCAAWSERLGLDHEIELAPYGQVFQELLDPDSAFHRNRRGVCVVLIRPEDWPREESDRTAGELIAAFEAYSVRAAVPSLVCICPPSGAAVDAGRMPELDALERRLAGGMASIPGVHLLGSRDWSHPYHVDEPDDPIRAELAHIPYTPLAYTALGTHVMRAVHGLVAPPFKVLALDCDNTLWEGVCGEDGPCGVRLGDGHRALQEWAAGLSERGVLVCLCSKNARADVDAVFERRPEMPLRPEHLAAVRVDWEAKAANLTALARELDVGIDSVVFIDDNPIEVSAVRAARLGVLALTLPENPGDWPHFLARIWAFDSPGVTAEDRGRTAFYRARRELDALSSSAASFADFIAGLQQSIEVTEVTEGQLDRVAQLTQRTNQFNLSSRRRTLSELRALLDEEGVRCRVVCVRDRLGDHGLVGAAITRRASAIEQLDTFLMSCRALGRGAEHALLAAVGAAAPGAMIEAVHIPTDRNAPVRRFLDEVLAGNAMRREDGTFVYRAPAGAVAAVAFDPHAVDGAGDMQPHEPLPEPSPGMTNPRRLEALAALAGELRNVGDVHRLLIGEPAPELDIASPAAPQDAEQIALGLVRDALAHALRRSRDELGADVSLESLRIPSLAIVDATAALERRFGRLPRTLLFEHRTIGEVARSLVAERREHAPAVAPPRHRSGDGAGRAPRRGQAERRGDLDRCADPPRDRDDLPDGAIAVVGLAGRYPGARDVDELWALLSEGRSAVSKVPPERWDHDRIYDPAGGPGRSVSAWAATIEGIDEFDALFFGIAPRDAEQMDPQQRIFLEVAYAALQDAGHTPRSLGRDVGVYVGAMAADYALLSAAAALEGRGSYPYAERYQIANRVSHALDLTGPSVLIDTACSASGVALHEACEAIRRGAVTAAIAGGVNVVLHPARHIQYSQMGMLSRRGRCASFGAGADGFVIGEGAGALLLRPLADAIADGDQVHGVIRASVVNADGRTNGFTVPSPVAQARLIGAALDAAGLTANEIGYVEAHGSGTELGDPIEIRALDKAFGARGGRHASCPVGSIKSAIGHLEAAAAIAGVTKVLLQLRHGMLAPSLHAEEPNPHIDFADTPLRIQRELADWTGPRRAGVSSFGAGGVNVHLILEGYDPEARRGDVAGPELIVLSASDDDRLRASAARLRDALRARDDWRLCDVAHTLRAGREAMIARAAFVVHDAQQLTDTLDEIAGAGLAGVDGVLAGSVRPGSHLAGLFAGAGASFPAQLAEGGELRTVGALWVEGADIDWQSVLPRGDRRRVSLPSYPWRRTRHWLPEHEDPSEPALATVGVVTAGLRAVWEPAPGTQPTVPPGACLVVLDAEGPEHATGDLGFARVVRIHAVDRYERRDAGRYAVRAADERDWQRLLGDLAPAEPVVVLDLLGARSEPLAPAGPLPRALGDPAVARALARAAIETDGPCVRYVALTRPAAEDPAAAAVAGFAQALAHETDRLRVVRVEADVSSPPLLLAQLVHAALGDEPELALRDGACWVRRLGAAPLPEMPPHACPPGGAVLISGGAGAIGRIMAGHLVERSGASVALLGRRPADADVERLAHELGRRGGRVIYLQADVCDEEAVARAVATARKRFGRLDGVIHAAGVIDDAPLRAKDAAAFNAVLAAKVRGAVVLDRATAQDELGFFCLMSSFVGTVGNAGQTDYAAANRFLDAFAERRAAWVHAGRRQGRSISIAWPPWEAGGMRMASEMIQLTSSTVGLRPIASAEALRAFDAGLATDEPFVLVAHGDPDRTEAALGPVAAAQSVNTAAAALSRGELVARLVAEAAALAKLEPGDIDPDRELGAYGFDSVLLTALANRLNAALGSAVTPVTLFRHPTLRSLAPALEAAGNLPGPAATAPLAVAAASPAGGPRPAALEPVAAEPAGAPATRPGRRGGERIAVVGLAGRFPGSADVDALWEHLRAGDDLVGDVPPERWDWHAIEGDPHLEPNTTDCHRGGFLDDVDAFDAAHFGISPRETHLMDPQQRLFLETCWHALQDSGRDPWSLGGTRTGVFAGVTLSDYLELLLAHEPEIAAHTVTGNVHSIVPNRVSHAFDLRGPSEAIDAACASSLVAVHRAVRSLRSGECELAIAGGVNVLLSPTWFVSLSRAGMLSSSGRCHAFDARADGYVRGEGVGAVVLKPLDRAIEDGDPVHGVILGSAVGHGGRAHSLTAPNPAAQADVITAALHDAAIDACTVGFVETHGTGTELGDPVELDGLREAYGAADGGPPAPGCVLGAVKASIGHLESAAGIAGLASTLLALRHRTLPPNAAFSAPNPLLELSRGPFRVLDAPEPWPAPVDASGRLAPRRAGVSSFGFGGSNAHLILEEPPPRPSGAPRRTPLQRTVLDHSRRHGLTSATTAALRAREAPRAARASQPAGAPPVPARTAADACRPALFERRWEPVTAPPDGSPPEHAPTCLLLVGRGSALPVVAALRPQDATWIVVREHSPLPRLRPDEHEIDFDDRLAGAELAERVLDAWPQLDAVIDLVDVDEHARPLDREGARVALLQALARRARTRPLRLVHATRGVVAAGDAQPRLAGARMAALVRAVGAEYAAVRATTLDLDPGASAEAALAATVHELALAPESEVCLRGGDRLVPHWSELQQPAVAGDGFGTFTIDPLRCYLVTGGTGGLGSAAAERLAERGARRLALLGRRALPPRERWDGLIAAGDERAPTLTRLRRLERAGVELSLHHGSLADRPALAAFLDRTRTRLGPVAGVLHCAGAISNAHPPFVDKSLDEIASIWEPKGAGLLVLDELVRRDEPDFVVLYASLSGALPELAVGLADYASANGFLDAFAAHAGRRRGSRTRYLAIDWGSWTGLGMGEVRSPRYAEHGFGALDREAGLDLLERALATGATCLIAGAARPGAPVSQPDQRLAPLTDDDPASDEATPYDDDDARTPDAGLRGRTIEHVAKVLAAELMVERETIDVTAPFAELGVDSILVAGLVAKLEPLAGRPIEPSAILEHPSVEALADHVIAGGEPAVETAAEPPTSEAKATVPTGGLMSTPPGQRAPAAERAELLPAAPRHPPARVGARGDRETDPAAIGPLPLAVIGIAGRFPGAPSSAAFWQLLRDGRNAIGEVPASRWSTDALYSPEPAPGRTVSRWGGFLADIEAFDPAHFGIPEDHAAHVDPVIRLFLECTDQAIRDAGYEPSELRGRRIGVFAGAATSSYGERIGIPGRGTVTGLNQNFIAAQAAHVYDLRGPNMVVDTACSSSLTALALAQQALTLGECELALVGGADVLLDERPYLKLSAAGALSPDGACRAFDVNANGIVLGEGAGVVVVKPLGHALADGDRIDAVVEAVATNNDGRTMGLTTPNPEAQERLIRDALARANVDADTVSYVEAHGTGTMIGDPIELRALTRAFRATTHETGFCAVGSVKSNVGHLLMAAGQASLQKVVLSLVHRELPPTLHCEQPNPRFSFAESPFFPTTTSRPWMPRHGIRRAGISAFGFGGCNAHAIVRELTQAERSGHHVARAPLAPAAFERRRYWVERTTSHDGAGNGHRESRRRAPRPILELQEESS